MHFCEVYYFITIICFIQKPVLTDICNSFENVFGQFVDKDGLKFNQTIDGCIERVRFDGKTITEAYIRNQDIKTLGRDSVRNVIHLSTISFWACTIKEILPGAFRNVLDLKTIQISFCKLKEIPKGVFNEVPQLEVLRIHDNQIDIIENDAFTNLTALKKVYADQNKLEYWNREWFGDSRALELVDFQFNKIRTIPRRAFELMPKLREIYFDYNEIRTIQADAFKGLEYLKYLGLRNNRLKDINENIFPDKLKIRTLLISANYLNTISTEVLKKISVKDIVMDYNPWNCSCLDRILYWIHTTNTTLRRNENCYKDLDVPVCAIPKVYSQTCLDRVDDELTQNYLNVLRNIPRKAENKGCARLE